MSGELESLDELMHEKEVMEKWRSLFAEDELREARQAKRIEWFDLRKGPHYTEEQLVEYLETRKRARGQRPNPLDPGPEQPELSLPPRSEAWRKGLDKQRRAAASLVTGTSPESALEFAAEALAQKIRGNGRLPGEFQKGCRPGRSPGR